ncbi:MAG: phage portal protein [Phycisphaeraceae bacterium]|nr:phage portal protein [Phycisphaeraceae bacterium]
MTDRLLASEAGASTDPEMSTLARAIEAHRRDALPRLERLWTYFRNAPETLGIAPWAFRRTRHGQETGLPPRLRPSGSDPRLDDRWQAAPEIVIENDIAWRIQTMVDFMVGRPVRILSTIDDPARAAQIDAALDAVWEASGGIALLQDMALLGHVYGHVDLVVRAPEPTHIPDSPADAVRIELIEPTRGLALQNPHDFRIIDAYAILTDAPDTSETANRASRAARPALPQSTTTTIELLTPTSRHILRRTTDAFETIDESIETAFEGRLPIVHIQNVAQPFRYEGLSEVEQLIPLQDELNTRLSDRASRVTLQSFRMFLAKGLDNFDGTLIGPGRVFATDNPDASILPFGGDTDSPSEARHIDEIREAMDKISGVPPLAGGVVRAKLGNLSSANALRITLLSLLARTARKRFAYGRGILEASRLALAALDAAGILRTTPAERSLRLAWPDPLPPDLTQEIAAAKAKQDLGIPRDQILAELGYAPDNGIE